MKLEVGMWVRLKDGTLWKPTEIKFYENNGYLFDDYYFYEIDLIHNASHNLIDLIKADLVEKI